MVDIERFDKFNDLCNKSKEQISSIKETQEIGNKMQDILFDPGPEPIENAEGVLIAIISENIFLRIVEFITKVDTENIKLSDEELKLLEEKNGT